MSSKLFICRQTQNDKNWKNTPLVAATIAVSGCQLLIDNRSRESGAVVVVPSDEWEAMRQASAYKKQTTQGVELAK